MSKSKIMIAALMGSCLNINTSNWFGPKGATGNKYKPHQGKKEIARRLLGKPVSKPRRMWFLGDEAAYWHGYGDSYTQPLHNTSRKSLIRSSGSLFVVLLP
jgi:hypothetical protein